ncbi:MAG: response regulator transcription factor [Candidatus Obscuribacterales bacterium]
MAKIIVIEDEESIAQSLVSMLEFLHHIVEVSNDGLDGWEKLQSGDYDLVILDRGLPGLEGLEILQRFRARGGSTPVLFLTGRDKVTEKIDGLNSGADDYLTKPFDMREFQARVQALLRRPKAVASSVLQFRDLCLDLSEHRCTRDGKELKLLPKEFALLEFLIQNRNKVYSPDQLVDRVWTTEDEVSIDAIRQCVKRLRTKIDLPGEPSYVTTVVGVGYKVEDH